MAYGLACVKGRSEDLRRSGLYVKTGRGRPRRLPRPTELSSVDLLGSRVAAVEEGNGLAVTANVTGTDLHTFKVGGSEGDTEALVRGLALSADRALWTLTDVFSVGNHNQTSIYRLTPHCTAEEVMTNPAPPDVQPASPATDLAVDGTSLYLVVPGIGITTHTFAPVGPSGCLP